MAFNKRSLWLWAATAVFYVAFVSIYERYTQQVIQNETKRFAALLEIHLWNYDYYSTLTYFAIIAQARDYTQLSIKHNNGKDFATQNNLQTFWPLDHWLYKAGLQREKTFRIPLRYKGELIGELTAVWRNRNIYLHLNIALLLILIVAVANYAGKVAGQEHELAERRKIEVALRQSEAKWRSLVENAPDIILTLDRDLRLTYINRGEGSLTPEWLRGKKITEIFPSPDSTKGIAAFARVMATGERLIYDADFVDPHTGIQRFFSARMGPVVEDGVIQAVLLIVTEVTEKRKHDLELQKAKLDAEKANRLKTDFLANMSHEIRTPLNVILGYTSLVEKFARNYLPSERVVYFEYIRNAGRRLMDTIQKIVDISRFHIEDFPFEPEPVAIDQLVESCVAELKVLADQKNLTLNYTPPLESLWVNFDRYALTQTITNIVENAIKYTQVGHVSVRLFSDQQTVQLVVQDTGIGISAEYLPNIFDEFSQEQGGYSRPFEGTGLGMALVKKFLDLGQGKIHINSDKGKGTTVTLTFAAIAAPSQTPARQAVLQLATPPATKSLPTVRASILVVEDDASTQAFMRTALGDAYDIRIASSSSEAEAEIAAKCPDLILMDLSLRGNEDGVMLTRKIRARPECKHTPIVALTAHALDTDRDNALLAGCNDYLAKPCPLDKLLETVARYTT